MHKPFSSPIHARRSFVSRVVLAALISASVCIFQGCGGSSSPHPASSTQNPAPGVTLEQIKITPSNSIILLAEARQLFATGIYSDGSSIDISTEVNWSTASTSVSSANVVSVDKNGIATAQAVGQGVVTATVGSVVGLIQFTVTTNGFSSTTMSILQVPYKNTSIDVGYIPLQTKIQDVYTVQAVNLDADQFASVLPPPVALKASIPMPSGFLPNATAASQSSARIAVISYTSPNVQIIDGSNDPLDVSSNTLIATYTSPVTQSVIINGATCMICAAIVNPLNDQLILSTAEGFYTMDMTTGAFAAIPFSSAPLHSANLSLNPAAPQPYILSTIASAGVVQILNLTTNAVTTLSDITSAPTASAIDIITGYAAIADGGTAILALADLTDLQTPVTSSLEPLGVCSGAPPVMNMVSMGVTASSSLFNTVHTLFTSQTGGNCVGLQLWPNQPISGSFSSTNPSLSIPYGYGPLPATPTGQPFINGNDPNTIATFTSVLDKKDYGVLVNASQEWVAKIDLAAAVNLGNINNGLPLPVGVPIPPAYLSSGLGGDPILFLPTPPTNFTLSIANLDFGTVTVGAPSPTSVINLSNIGMGDLNPQITLQGANAGDFLLDTTCSFTLATQSNCAINITFTPTASGTRSARLTVTNSGEPAQTVPLSGTGS